MYTRLRHTDTNIAKSQLKLRDGGKLVILKKESTVSLMGSKGMLYFIYTVVANGDCKVQFYNLAASILNIEGKKGGWWGYHITFCRNLSLCGPCFSKTAMISGDVALSQREFACKIDYRKLSPTG